MDPHDERVLVPVVALAHPDRGHPEATIEGLGGGVGNPHFQGEAAGTLATSDVDQLQHEAATHPLPPVSRVDHHRGDVGLLPHHHQTAVADEATLIVACLHVGAPGCLQLVSEDLLGPGGGIGAALQLDGGGHVLRS